MDTPKIIVGLDIGTTKICVLVGRMNEYGKLDIIGVGKQRSDGVVRGQVTNVDKTVSSIILACKDAELQSGEQISDVIVGIAGHHVRTLTSQGSLTRKTIDDEICVDDVYRLIREQSRQVIPPGNTVLHVIPQDYIVDNDQKVTDPVGMTGIKLEGNYHIITTAELAVLNIRKSLKRAGLNITELILEPLASSLSVLSEEEKEMGVALVDIGGGTTDITVFNGGIVRHTVVIPFGGNNLTSDINKGLSILEKDAENLKVNFGTSFVEDADEGATVPLPGLGGRPGRELSAPALAHIIHWRMLEILGFVHNEIIASGFEQKLGAGIVLTGGGANLANVDKLCAYVTGLETRIGFPNEHLGQTIAEEVKTPSFATGVGLVLAGYHSFDERENRYRTDKVNIVADPINYKSGTPAAGGTKKAGFFDWLKNSLIDPGDSGNANY